MQGGSQISRRFLLGHLSRTPAYHSSYTYLPPPESALISGPSPGRVHSIAIAFRGHACGANTGGSSYEWPTTRPVAQMGEASIYMRVAVHLSTLLTSSLPARGRGPYGLLPPRICMPLVWSRFKYPDCLRCIKGSDHAWRVVRFFYSFFFSPS